MSAAPRRRRMGAAAIATALLFTAPAMADAPSGPPAPPTAARLEGFFGLDGTVTKAVNVPGEHTGQLVQRVWAFIPLCDAGACATVKLVRQRGAGFDTLILHRSAPAFYAGSSQFYAPVRCGGVRYRKGELVSYKVTVRVIAAVLGPTGVDATFLRAVYSSSSRRGLTACVSASARDAAGYLGVPQAPAPAGSIRIEASTRLSSAS